MAYMKQAKTESEIKSLTVSNVKKAYNELARDYNKLIDGDVIICPTCGEPVARSGFYKTKKNAIGVYPECKRCIVMQVEQKTKKTDKSNETKESVKKMLHKMDLPYKDELYESVKEKSEANLGERDSSSPFVKYMIAIQSLPQYRDKTWADSEFELGFVTDEEETKLNAKTIKNAKKRFGNFYNNEDLMFLEEEYQDWIHRYECNTKVQESLFERLSLKKLEIRNATKSGKPTKDLDKTYQEILSTANITPRQMGSDTLSEAQTLGTLIQKWENEKPIPEIDPELADVDHIGEYIDVFFKGHLSKMLGLKNNLSHIYQNFMDKFTVTRPEYEEDSDSEALFDQIFGSGRNE